MLVSNMFGKKHDHSMLLLSSEYKNSHSNCIQMEIEAGHAQ